jgi:hypothetical protein
MIEISIIETEFIKLDSPDLNPFTNIKGQEKIEYNNGYVNWLGAFTQLEYSNENLSAFFQGQFQRSLKERILYLFGNGSFVQN